MYLVLKSESLKSVEGKQYAKKKLPHGSLSGGVQC